LERYGLGGVVGSDTLALLTDDVVVVLGVVVIYLVFVLIFLDTEIVVAVKLEVVIVGLPNVSDSLLIQLYAYIVSCLSSVPDVVVIVTTTSIVVRVGRAVLKTNRVERLVACKVMLEGHIGKATTTVRTIEDEGFISHVADG
jgi:hypothetical protein